MSTERLGSRFPFGAMALLSTCLFAGMACAEETSFDVSLSGASDGDPEGQGQGVVTIDSASNQVSWDLSYSDIGEPNAMHIHEGAAGQSGGVVVPLTVQTDPDGKLVGLMSAPPEVVDAILASPASYYVNIHNDEYPGGAIRGQLGG